MAHKKRIKMKKINQIERISYAGGLYGLIAGSSKGKLQKKVSDMNDAGWNLHFIHPESLNLIKIIIRIIFLIITLSIWTIGLSELLVFEKNSD